MNYVLFGEEQYRLKATLKNLISEYVKDDEDLNVVRYDALQSTLSMILEDAQTIPFFADFKVVLVYHSNFLSTNNDTSIDPNELEEYLKHPCPTTILIFLGDFAKLDARKKIIKKLKESKDWKILEFRKLDEVAKLSCIQEELKRRGIRIDTAALHELEKRLPLDMETIHREMDKLELYGDSISRELVTQLISKPLEEDVFQLVNAVVERNVKKAFSIWQDLCVVNTDAIYLIALLAGQFRFLYQIKALMMQGQGKDQIVSTLSAHPYRVKVSMDCARNLNIAYLHEVLEKLATLDQKLKGGLLDKKLGFEMFLLELQGVKE